jgi:hypothetical protein
MIAIGSYVVSFFLVFLADAVHCCILNVIAVSLHSVCIDMCITTPVARGDGRKESTKCFDYDTCKRKVY